MNVDKKQFKDEKGRYIVQGLFLEDKYNTDLAVYTFDGEDKFYKGKTYPSLKRLYLEEGDIEEYQFANKYLYDWPHWQRLCKNAIVGRHIEQWREELALSLRSEGIATLVDLAINDKSYQAAKWLADEGWIKNKRGRPSKAQIEEQAARKAKIEEEFAPEFELLELHTRKGK
ncbi:MAG: hypothetical protein CMN30_31820 [Sandaracinus sp.]|nr:hypothetical protein [Sandaracinus sp.]